MGSTGSTWTSGGTAGGRAATRPGGWRAVTARRLLHRALDGLRGGTVTVVDGGAETVHGSGDPAVRIAVNAPAFYRRAVFGGVLGAGESYMDGDWDCDDLVGLVRLLTRDRRTQDEVDRGRGLIATCADSLRHLARRNSRRGSARNVEAHYDLGNDFFRLFLDERMMYSAAVFDDGCESLEAASTAKIERLCRKLRLAPGEELLEIGGGWGGLAVHAAERFGCRVTTVTLSPAQADHARALVRERGLDGRVDVVLADYRDLTGRFDKLVSVEMIEAVGHRFLPAWFRACSRLLKPHGLLALQAITIRDRRYRQGAAVGGLHQEAHLSRRLHSERLGAGGRGGPACRRGARRPRGHRRGLCADAAGVEPPVRGPPRRHRRPRLRRAFPAALALLLRVLRGRFPGARHQRRADAVRDARLPGADAPRGGGDPVTVPGGLMRLAESGRLPDAAIRAGIRLLLRRRLREEAAHDDRRRLARRRAVLEELRRGPIAARPDLANAQHYEVPAAFFRAVLGPRMKYSACHWPPGVDGTSPPPRPRCSS